MNEDLRRSDERHEVVRAAESWHAAAAIGDAALATIRERYPDDRRRARPGFRVLFFVFTLLAAQAAFFFCLTFLGAGLFAGADRTIGLLQTLFAAACGLAAESAISAHKMRGFGIDEALVALTLGFGTGAAAMLVGTAFDGGPGASFVFAVLGGLAAVAAWRWGVGLTGLAAGIGLFGVLYWTPAPRSAWIVAGSLLAVFAWRAAQRPATGAAHRGRWRELYVVAVLALYAAVHIQGFERHWYDSVGAFLETVLGLPSGVRVASWAAMGFLPAVLVTLGLRERDELSLTLGSLLAIATGASAMAELVWGPVWLRLLMGGAVLLGAALAARRLFARHPDRTAGGFTDVPLFAARRATGLVELAAAIAVFTPAPEGSKPEGFGGEGGDFGGGGASGKF